MVIKPYDDGNKKEKVCKRVAKMHGYMVKESSKRTNSLVKKDRKLFNSVISNLTRYYSLAISRNPNFVEDMKKEMDPLLL